MINEKEIKTLEKYQFWKTVIKKEERQNYNDGNIKYYFLQRTPGCSGREEPICRAVLFNTITAYLLYNASIPILLNKLKNLLELSQIFKK